MPRKQPSRRPPRPGHEPGACPHFDGEPVYPGPDRNGMYMPLERRVAWPLDTVEYQEFEARRNLEQVGHILKRLELDQADIVRLRTETRVILAELAA